MNHVILFLLAFMAGLGVSMGFMAFLVLLGIVPRLAAKTRTANQTLLYEDMIVLGITLGNIVFLYHVPLPFRYLGMILCSVFFGIFTGCLAGALAEMVKIFPILTRRLHLRRGLPYVVFFMAAGKAFGTILQWFVLANL